MAARSSLQLVMAVTVLANILATLTQAQTPPPYHFTLQVANTDGITTVKAGGTPYVQLLQTSVELGACGMFAIHTHNSDELIYVRPGAGPIGYMVALPGGVVHSDIIANDTVVTFPEGAPHTVWNPTCKPVHFNGMFNILALTNNLMYQAFDNAPQFAFNATYRKKPVSQPPREGYIIQYNRDCLCACGISSDGY